jgi:hypothetical protein
MAMLAQVRGVSGGKGKGQQMTSWLCWRTGRGQRTRGRRDGEAAGKGPQRMRIEGGQLRRYQGTNLSPRAVPTQ